MEVSVPTFLGLNKAQRRAFLLRDRLRNVDTAHLDEHIDGISNEEPPHYKMVSGVVVPTLVQATLRTNATCFDLGNVHFDDVGNGKGEILRAYLTVEEGQTVELRTAKALPMTEANFDSVPIHIFIAKSMVPMFEAKYRAMHSRMNNINKVRKVAYGLTKKPFAHVQQGQTLPRLDYKSNEGTSPSKDSKKRKPGDPVSKHKTNKRLKIGLEAVPDAMKSAIFHDIPHRFKVDLFNNVVTTAFPNFDNLMMASWNVVSIYSNAGTDFKDLHKSIVELKAVLQDFDGAFGEEISTIEPKVRHDFAIPRPNYAQVPKINKKTEKLVRSADDVLKEPTPSVPAAYSAATSGMPQRKEHDYLFEGSDSSSDIEENEAPPPRLLEFSQRPTNMVKPTYKAEKKTSTSSKDLDRRGVSTPDPRHAPRLGNETSHPQILPKEQRPGSTQDPRQIVAPDQRQQLLGKGNKQQVMGTATVQPVKSALPHVRDSQLSQYHGDTAKSSAPSKLAPTNQEQHRSSSSPRPQLFSKHQHQKPRASSETLQPPNPSRPNPEPVPRCTESTSTLPPVKSAPKSAPSVPPRDSQEPAGPPAKASEDNQPVPKPRSLSEYPLAELKAQYKERREAYLQNFGGMKNVPAMAKAQLGRIGAEIKAREEKIAVLTKERDGEDKRDAGEVEKMIARGKHELTNSAVGAVASCERLASHALGMGTSLLGRKKADSGAGTGEIGGRAPVAVMVHNRPQQQDR